MIERIVDPFGNITLERFPSSMEVKMSYDCFDRPLSLEIEGAGKVLYTYDPLFLREVTRVSSLGETLYSHAYPTYDTSGHLLSEIPLGNLSPILHTTDLKGQKTSISSPYFSQNCTYDGNGNLITNLVDDRMHHYSYDELSQLSLEKGPLQSFAYTHDSLYNRREKNEASYGINDLNELLSQEYDLNGNQILNQTARFSYDPLGQLTQVIGEKEIFQFTYDPLGRRVSKKVFSEEGEREEHYLYHNQEEIGAFTSSGVLKNLKILGLHSTPVALEIGKEVFAPLLDVQGSVRRLLDPKGTIAARYNFSAFGEELQVEDPFCNPWRFAAKRIDPELNLIYFGKRYLDPQLGRWLSPDPAGFVDSANPYQYVLNNPFKYRDPRGESLGGFLLGLGEIVLGSTLIVTGGMLEIATLGGYTIGFGFQEAAGVALIGHGLSMTISYAQEMPLEKRSSPPSPDPKAEGHPHTTINAPGPSGSYTTHNGDGTYKQYRGSGKPHGNIDVTPDLGPLQS